MKKNLKIIIPVAIVITILAVVGIVFFTSKGGGNGEAIDEKTDFLSQATILDLEKLNSEKKKNEARAKETYQDKIFILTTTVSTIETNYFYGYDIGGSYLVTVYLKNKEELIELNKDDNVVIVGKMTNMTTSRPEISSAYIITDNENLIWAKTKENGYDKITYCDYTYNDNGLITGYKEKRNNYTYEITLEYDNKGNLTTRTQKSNSNETETESNSYNEDNTINTTSITTSNPDNIENGKVFQYTYEKDDKNRIIKKTSVTTTRDNYTLVYTYEYDDKDRISKETQTSPNSTYEITYEYDKNDNVITKRSKRLDKQGVSSTTYKYEVVGIKSKK